MPSPDPRAHVLPRPLWLPLSVCLVLRAVATLPGAAVASPHLQGKSQRGPTRALFSRACRVLWGSQNISWWPAVGAGGPGRRGHGYEVQHADPPAVPPRVTVGTPEGTKAPAKQQEGRTLCPWDPRAAAVTGWTSFRGQRPSPPASRGGCDVGMCAAPCPRPVSPGSAPQRGQGLRHRWAASLSTLQGRRSDFVVDTGVESVVAFTCIRF